jgi:molybdenum cofactor cytidylyltransferase
MQAELQGLSVTIITNREWAEGMSSSLRAGLRMLSRFADAALILLCDQPLISQEILNTIIDAHVVSGNPLVASEYSDTIGVPALFGKELFPELMELTGDAGAKSVLIHHRQHASSVRFNDGTVDIDTQADYKRLTS